VKQKVAATLHQDEYILLAGDAAHTHSSAFAQGMNTGVHDAMNLVWKLSGVIKGWYGPEVLATYGEERREAAQKLIRIDKTAAAALSGEVSTRDQQLGLSSEDALQSILETHMNFTIGLGVSYPPSILNQEPTTTGLQPGTRGPDVLIHTPGPAIPIRLHQILHSQGRGRWHVLVFTGHCYMTKAKVVTLREHITAPGRRSALGTPLIQLITIMLGTAGSAWEAFDGPVLGKLYFDTQAPTSAHDKYGVYPDNGAIVILRPDGIFAYATELDEYSKVDEYFGQIYRPERTV
jgi:phenol 2-monooxygenase (NADPH)